MTLAGRGMTPAGRLPALTWDRVAPLREKAGLHPDGPVDLSMGTPVDPARCRREGEGEQDAIAGIDRRIAGASCQAPHGGVHWRRTSYP